MKNRRKLRNLLVDPLFQFRYSIYVLAVVVVSALSVGTFARIFLNRFLQVMLELSDVSAGTRLLLEEQLRTFFLALLLLLAIVVVIVFVYLIVHTHRIAGAEYAVRRFVIEHLQRRDFDARLTLRKNDYLSTLARELNSLADLLKKE